MHSGWNRHICKLLKTTVLIKHDINWEICCLGVLIDSLIAEIAFTGNKQDHTAFSCTSLLPKLSISKAHLVSLSLHKPLSWLTNFYCKHLNILTFSLHNPTLLPWWSFHSCFLSSLCYSTTKLPKPDSRLSKDRSLHCHLTLPGWHGNYLQKSN